MILFLFQFLFLLHAETVDPCVDMYQYVCTENRYRFLKDGTNHQSHVVVRMKKERILREQRKTFIEEMQNRGILDNPLFQKIFKPVLYKCRLFNAKKCKQKTLKEIAGKIFDAKFTAVKFDRTHSTNKQRPYLDMLYLLENSEELLDLQDLMWNTQTSIKSEISHLLVRSENLLDMSSKQVVKSAIKLIEQHFPAGSQRTKIIERIKKITFISSFCEGPLVQNATYAPPPVNKVKYCVGTMSASDSIFTLTGILAHEVAHSFDPCRWSTLSKFPLKDLLKCLKSDKSVHAFEPDISLKDEVIVVVDQNQNPFLSINVEDLLAFPAEKENKLLQVKDYQSLFVSSGISYSNGPGPIFTKLSTHACKTIQYDCEFHQDIFACSYFEVRCSSRFTNPNHKTLSPHCQKLRGLCSQGSSCKQYKKTCAAEALLDGLKCKADSIQTYEAFADWFAAEVLADMFSGNSFEEGYLHGKNFQNGVSNIFKPLCPASVYREKQRNTPRSRNIIVPIGKHPSTRKRMNAILINQPTLRKFMGCKEPHPKYQYCENKLKGGAGTPVSPAGTIR